MFLQDCTFSCDSNPMSSAAGSRLRCINSLAPSLNMSDASATQPLLRWAGSKRKLIPILKEYWRPDFGRYIEPFAGSAALFFALRPKAAVLSDVNEEVIHLLRTVRESPQWLARRFRRAVVNKSTYLALRKTEPSSLSSRERAFRLVYLNRNCFNGLYRTNRLGQFNVPYSESRQPALPSSAQLHAVHRSLQGVTLLRKDFETVVRSKAREGDFVYLDPPFYVTTRRVFVEYGPKEFGPEDLLRLRGLLTWMDSRGVSFLLSYADSPQARGLAAGFHSRAVTTTRNIGGFVSSRRAARELLISNCSPASRERAE